MVVTQPWLRERRLSLGAAAQGQYYLSDVNLGAPPPLGPHFPRPIRPEPPSSHPCSALTEPCMRLSGTDSGAGTAANGTVGTTPTPGIAAATAAAVTAFSGRADDAFSSILRPSQFGPGCRTYGVGRNTAVGQLGRLPGGAGRLWPGQVVGGGRARGRGGGSDGCRGPRRASARAFRDRRAISRNCNMCPRSDLGCPVEYQSDLGCFGHAKVMYFHVVYSVFNDANEYNSPNPSLPRWPRSGLL
jgi:hypothetical protein